MLYRSSPRRTPSIARRGSPSFNTASRAPLQARPLCAGGDGRISGGELPDDPFRTGRDAMPVAEALKAVGALDEEDLRGMIISRLLTTRLHFTAEPAGTITFDRDHLRPYDEAP
jgi:hypothetical protein